MVVVLYRNVLPHFFVATRKCMSLPPAFGPSLRFPLLGENCPRMGVSTPQRTVFLFLRILIGAECFRAVQLPCSRILLL